MDPLSHFLLSPKKTKSEEYGNTLIIHAKWIRKLNFEFFLATNLLKSGLFHSGLKSKLKEVAAKRYNWIDIIDKYEKQF